VALGVDFSAPGAYAASFDCRRVYVRDAYLGLDIHETALSGAAPEVLLASLQGTYAVLDAEGKKLFSGSLAQDVDTVRLPGFELIRLVHWGYFPLGKCKINVTVAQGAPELKGIPQRLVVVIDDGLAFTTSPSIRSIMYIGCVCLLLAVIVTILTARIAVSVCAKKRRDKSQLSFESDHVERGRSTSR